MSCREDFDGTDEAEDEDVTIAEVVVVAGAVLELTFGATVEAEEKIFIRPYAYRDWLKGFSSVG